MKVKWNQRHGFGSRLPVEQQSKHCPSLADSLLSCVTFRHCRPSICMLVHRCNWACSNNSTIRWQVIAETYTSSGFTNIVGEDLYNAYQNITVVELCVFEPGTEDIPGALVSAHHHKTTW